MSTSERIDPKAGPFCNLSHAYFSNVDLVAKAYEPAFRGAARWNLEVMGLATRRARVWFELPGRLGKCRTPQDLVRESVEYWQGAARDYTDGARRLTAAFAAFAMPGVNGARVGSAPSRDYITFADPKPTAEESQRHDRRAA